ncbi:MAG: M20 peptidase family dipeptidase, partial [Hyphomicrobiales bacterium]|nr:M20 peptidase family dipeptidase [Hyphomicrobiales bacterium]
MSREQAVAKAQGYFDSGSMKTDLTRLVAIPTESQNPERTDELPRYIATEMIPLLESMGFACKVMTHPRAKGPFLFAERFEAQGLPTIFGYGHGDVIRGLDKDWHEGLSPWQLKEVGDRWYGRG